jgi:hypothetical protein
MALGGVFMNDTDGNIGTEVSSRAEKVCGLLFDISGQTNFWSSGYPATVASTFQNTVVELNSLQDAIDAGIKPYDAETDATSNFLHGIPYYHIKHFFDVAGGSGRLFVMFADCSTTFNAIIDMQRAASGLISQFGVWTEQYLWSHIDTSATQYAVRLVGDLNPIAQSLANDYNAPCVILLNANSAKVLGATTTETQYSYDAVAEPSGNPAEQHWYKSDGNGGYTEASETSVVAETTYYTRTGTDVTSTAIYTTVDIAKIPTCIVGKRYVSVLLGQGVDNEVSTMQCALESKTPVGNIGAALGILSIASVSESIGWVQYYDVVSQFPGVEFGFGDATLTSGKLTNPTSYTSLSQSQIDTIDDKGYIFLCTYSDYEGHVFFNDDGTCSDGDYRTIARNRVINKSRRLVRKALLPFVNAPIKVDPSSGALSSAQITIFSKIITDALNLMVQAEEASGIGQVNIPASQNILKNDKLNFSYTLVPIGTSKAIEVSEGLVLKQ